MIDQRERCGSGGFVEVGRVATFHGNRGEVRVTPFAEFPEQFRPGLKLQVRGRDFGTALELEIEAARQHRHFVIIKFAGIESIDKAESLRGATLEVARSELLALPKGHYYVFEIEGLEVVTTSGRRLGKVAEVISGVGNDVYEVVDRDESGRKRTTLLPAVAEVVKDIDLERGRMTVELIPGLE